MTGNKIGSGDDAYRDYVENIQALSNILEGRPERQHITHKHVEVRRCLARNGHYLKELSKDPDESVRKIVNSALSRSE